MVRDGIAAGSVWRPNSSFAGVAALLVGVLQAITGLVALFDDGYYAVTRRGFAVHITYTEWGWIHLGLALIGVGAGLLLGQLWGRVVAIGVAGLSAIANFLFLPAHPVWTMLMIAVDVLVIYAVAAHGREVRV